MSKTISFSLNSKEIVELCNKLGVRENELGKAMKALSMEKRHSPFFPKEFFQQKVDELKKLETQPYEEQLKDMSISDIEKELGIKGRNEKRRVKAAGLYFKKNVEDYMNDFVLNWNGDGFKVKEICFTLTKFWQDELAVRELLEREKV